MKFSAPRESHISTTDCEPVSRRSTRLRRGLVAAAVAVALPAAFATSPAAAAPTSPAAAACTVIHYPDGTTVRVHCPAN